MWFRFPKGTTEISVSQQNFRVEVTDEEGNAFFQAPDHFAPVILELKGFASSSRPANAPADMPERDTLRDGAISQLSSQLEAVKEENKGLRESMAVMQAALSAMTTERDNALRNLEVVRVHVKRLEEEAEEGDDASLTPEIESDDE